MKQRVAGFCPAAPSCGMTKMIRSISQAISRVRTAGLVLESDGDGHWRVGQSEWMTCRQLIALARRLAR